MNDRSSRRRTSEELGSLPHSLTHHPCPFLSWVVVGRGGLPWGGEERDGGLCPGLPLG
jgi:hypothetical protein